MATRMHRVTLADLYIGSMRLFWCLALVLGIGASGGSQSVAADTSPEYLVKAAFLYKFTKFVDWPPESSSEEVLGLCVLGDNPFNSALKSIEGKTVRGKRLSISNLDALDQTSECHLVFVSQSEEQRLPQIFRYLQDHHVLSVGDMDDFAKQGGVIGLVTEQNKIRFEINVAAARRAGLNISSNLLRLARVIDDGA